MTSPLLLRIAASDFRAQISHTNCYFNFQTEIVATSRRSKEPRETEQQETPQPHHLEELLRLRHTRHRQLTRSSK